MNNLELVLDKYKYNKNNTFYNLLYNEHDKIIKFTHNYNGNNLIDELTKLRNERITEIFLLFSGNGSISIEIGQMIFSLYNLFISNK